MGYHVYLFRGEVKQKYATVKDGSFLEEDTTFLPFTEKQRAYLKNDLLRRGYYIESENDFEVNFDFKGTSILAMLTRTGLYFSSGYNHNDVFEIRMTASEFTGDGEFEKYDPQYEGWEEIEY
ncbi:MAG: hypothetical protein RLZZ628_1341 [Bacteroidota bacterium]|jgi:hypothetical protein